MHKLRVTRAPLLAVLGFLAVLAVPAAAQAHHIEASASCELVGNVPTASWEVRFVGFGTPGSKNVDGHVTLDGATVQSVPPSSVTWYGNDGSLPGSAPAAGESSHTVRAEFTWVQWGKRIWDSVTLETGTCPKPKYPGIKVVKDGPATAYVGSQVTYSFQVSNIGDVALTNPVVTDDKCAPVTKVPDGQSSFDPGDVWNYTCTTTITDAMGDSVVNTVEACGEYGNQKVCDTDEHTTRIPKPRIELEKTGAATAAAGSSFTYSFKATNTGNVTLANVALSDPKCQSTLKRVEPNLADATFDPGDVWNYTCTVVAPAGPAQVDNVAKVCGDYEDETLDKVTVCDEDPHTFTVPPSGNPPTSVPNGDGGVLPAEIVSGRAQLRGPSGCVKQAFRARVRGRGIASVTFFVDGRKVKTVSSGFRLKVNPKRYGTGRHKIVAVVRFTPQSATQPKRLPLTFRRCARGAVAPRFTG